MLFACVVSSEISITSKATVINFQGDITIVQNPLSQKTPTKVILGLFPKAPTRFKQEKEKCRSGIFTNIPDKAPGKVLSKARLNEISQK